MRKDNFLTHCILMDFPIQINLIRMGCSVLATLFSDATAISALASKYLKKILSRTAPRSFGF